MFPRIVAFLGALAIASLGELLPGLLPPRPWTWVPVLALGLAGLRWQGARDPASRPTWAQVILLWVILAVVLHGLGWARWVLLDLGWKGRPFVSIALLLLPFAVLGTGLRRSARLFLALAIVPATLLLCMELAWSAPALVETIQSSVSLQVLAIACVVAIAMPAAPFLILLAASSRALPPGPQREALERWSRQLGVRLRDIHVFGEESRSQLNACAVGFLPGTRRVFFTQGMVRHLDGDRLAAVFCHEVAHFARGHFFIFALLVVSFLLSLAPLLQGTAAMAEPVAATILLAYTILFWGLLHGAVSRRLETDADLTAARTVGFDLYASTLSWTAAAQGPHAHARGFRHDSLTDRERLILACGQSAEELARAAGTTLRLKRRVRCLVALCAAAFLACVVGDLCRGEAAVAALKGEAALSRAAELLPALEHTAASDERVPEWLSWAARRRGGIAREVAECLERAQSHLRTAAAGAAPAAEDLRRRLESVQLRKSSR